MGEVGDGAVLDLARLAIGLAQQVARVGLAVQAGGRAVDEHYDYEYAIKPTESQYNATIISGYIFRAKRPSNIRYKVVARCLGARGTVPLAIFASPNRWPLRGPRTSSSGANPHERRASSSVENPPERGRACPCAPRRRRSARRRAAAF